jgi:translation initiation factor 1
MKKKGGSGKSLVYSTDPDFQGWENEEVDESVDIPKGSQKLRVFIDRKQRGGKEVILISGFIGSESNLEELGKMLKKFCGVGGSVKDGQILIQGNQREKLIKKLISEGYTGTKASGG